MNEKSLWKCDDGTYDVVYQDEDGNTVVVHPNVPASVLAEAPVMADRIRELERALAGMLAIEGSVTQGQEADCRAYWVPIAKAALGANAGGKELGAKMEARRK